MTDRDMDKRTFLKLSVVTPLVLLSGTKVVAMARHYPLEQMVLSLKRLPADKLFSSGSWGVSEIFQHLAQSVRYSRLGYPLANSTLFQYTAGSLAFNAFAAAGTMQHPLDEVIPGAPALVEAVPADVALAELIHELELFISWQGDLAPHFAYGHLSKQQYYSAHYLHIQNHLAQISLS